MYNHIIRLGWGQLFVHKINKILNDTTNYKRLKCSALSSLKKKKNVVPSYY